MSPEFIDKAKKWLASRLAAEKAREEAFGKAPPIIQTEWEGKRIVVADGNRLYAIDPSHSFTGFLQARLYDAYGDAWWAEEMAKHPMARHQLAQWESHAQELLNGAVPDERGRYFVPQDGLITAYLTLAYDVFVLRNSARLAEREIQRLRNAGDFAAGVRYEILVAAAFVRAGFQVEPEDETDSSKTHPEFLATHRDSKFVLAVEAKARNRRASDKTPPRVGIDDRIEDAAKKAREDLPLALFLDVAMPPEDGSSPPSWADEIKEAVATVVNNHIAKNGGRGPFDWVFCTSIPHRWGSPKAPDPARTYWDYAPPDSRIPVEIRTAIAKAMMQYGNIPEFDDHPPAGS